MLKLVPVHIFTFTCSCCLKLVDMIAYRTCEEGYFYDIQNMYNVQDNTSPLEVVIRGFFLNHLRSWWWWVFFYNSRTRIGRCWRECWSTCHSCYRTRPSSSPPSTTSLTPCAINSVPWWVSVAPQHQNLETFEQICMYIKFYRVNLIDIYRYLSCFRYVYFKSTFIFIFEDSYLVLSW